jgi:hypothetical protein
MKTTELFAELCEYVSNKRYGEGYEFDFQMWAGSWNIYIKKDDVELTSRSGDTCEEVLVAALEYLKRIKAPKASL